MKKTVVLPLPPPFFCLILLIWIACDSNLVFNGIFSCFNWILDAYFQVFFEPKWRPQNLKLCWFEASKDVMVSEKSSWNWKCPFHWIGQRLNTNDLTINPFFATFLDISLNGYLELFFSNLITTIWGGWKNQQF